MGADRTEAACSSIEPLEPRLLLSQFTFAAPETFRAGHAPRSVAVADVNGDGQLDLLASNFSSPYASLFLGTGAGTFQAQQTIDTGLFHADAVATATWT